MRLKGELLIFNTGRTVRANCGVIGLGYDGNVYDGYDGHLWLRGDDKGAWWWKVGDEGLGPLTPEELIELGEFMVSRWQKFLSIAQTANYTSHSESTQPTENPTKS